MRKEMLTMSIILSIGGVIAEYLWWTRDWWRPITVTGTRVGIEDFLLGFTNGGIAAVIYEVIYKKRLYGKIKPVAFMGSPALIFLVFTLISIFYWVFELTSFWATSIALFSVGIMIVLMRIDLLKNAIISGILVSVLFLPFYWLAEYLSPGVIEKSWMLERLSGIRVTGVPIEDIVFYFLVGFAIGPAYEFCRRFWLRKY